MSQIEENDPIHALLNQVGEEMAELSDVLDQSKFYNMRVRLLKNTEKYHVDVGDLERLYNGSLQANDETLSEDEQDDYSIRSVASKLGKDMVAAEEYIELSAFDELIALYAGAICRSYLTQGAEQKRVMHLRGELCKDLTEALVVGGGVDKASAPAYVRTFEKRIERIAEHDHNLPRPGGALSVVS